MASKTEIIIHNTTYDSSAAVNYHYGCFPPPPPDLNQLQAQFTGALIALTQYDTLLRTLLSSDLLLAPLRARDAVVSSRMEGTISTLEEVLRLEADADDAGKPDAARNEALEVALYARALKQAESQIKEGYEISGNLIKNTHRILLSHGRGAAKKPGSYKHEQNYVGDKRRRQIDYIPASPEHLPHGMDNLLNYIHDDKMQPLLKTAIAHVEFEALHPFDDGNGRLGRMLITLMLWQTGVLSAPHFFVSDYFERNKDEYVERMRAVSQDGDWVGWCKFFLEALHSQALENIDVVGRIQAHYEEMQGRFRDILRSRWSVDALNYMFANPIFRNNRFKRNAGIPPQTANNFTNRLVEEGLLVALIPPSGRSPGMYAFNSLLEIVAEPS